MGAAWLRPRTPISTMPVTAPTAAAISTTGSSIRHPSQAPSAARSLKSPYPMPSRAVSARNR